MQMNFFSRTFLIMSVHIVKYALTFCIAQVLLVCSKRKIVVRFFCQQKYHCKNQLQKANYNLSKVQLAYLMKQII